MSIPVTLRSKKHFFLYLLIAGIELNPGPHTDPCELTTQFPCGVCSKEVEDFAERALACDGCDTWIHKACLGMLTAEYEELENSSAPWYCPSCGSPHHSVVAYNAPDIDSIGSMYSEVSDGEPSTSNRQELSGSSFANSSLNSLGSPVAQSSPKASEPHQKPTVGKNLRLLNINFQSTRSKGRNVDMLVESTKPDVIIGTEKWLSEDIKSTYFFNPTLGFKVYRRDRPNYPHSGVLLAVKSDIEVLDIHLHSTLELLSGNIKVGQKKMVLTAFYRPPKKVDAAYLQKVTQAFTTLKQKFKNAILIVAGDFNLPDIHWDSHTVTDNQYPHRVSETFLNIALDLSLEQVVNFPTRQENTLDLMFMPHPIYMVRCKPLPPVGYKSDHDVVLLDTAYRPHRARLPRRNLYLW